MPSKLNAPLWRYEMAKTLLYWICFGSIFAALLAISEVSPKSALRIIAVIDPLANFVEWLFWYLVSDHVVVSKVAQASRVPVVRVDALRALLFVTQASHLLRFVLVQIFLRRRFLSRVPL